MAHQCWNDGTDRSTLPIHGMRFIGRMIAPPETDPKAGWIFFVDDFAGRRGMRRLQGVFFIAGCDRTQGFAGLGLATSATAIAKNSLAVTSGVTACATGTAAARFAALVEAVTTAIDMLVAGAAFLLVAVPNVRVARVAAEVLHKRGRRQIHLVVWRASDDLITSLAVASTLVVSDSSRWDFGLCRLHALECEGSFHVDPVGRLGSRCGDRILQSDVGCLGIFSAGRFRSDQFGAGNFLRRGFNHPGHHDSGRDGLQFSDRRVFGNHQRFIDSLVECRVTEAEIGKQGAKIVASAERNWNDCEGEDRRNCRCTHERTSMSGGFWKVFGFGNLQSQDFHADDRRR